MEDQGRPIAVGEPANLTLVNPDATWVVHGKELQSKASNTPYEEMAFNAKIVATWLRGTTTYMEKDF